MVRGVSIKNHAQEQHLFERRALVAGAIVTVLTLVLLARLFVLQVVRHEYFAELSQGNRVRIEPIPAARGLILDRKGAVLASNQPAYQLEMVREEVPDVEKALRDLIGIGLLSPDDLDDVRRAIRSRRSFESVPVRLRLSEEDIARFAVRRFEFPGLDIKTRLARSYPHGEIAVHALGYVGAISERDLERIDRKAYSGTATIGKLGVESAFEKELHGTNGSREVLVNAQGRSVERQGAFEPDLRIESPIAGQDLRLAMDLDVQRAAEEALGDRRGSVVAIDPNNGDVIALVSRPGFDPHLFGRGLTRAEYDALQTNIDRPLLNRALRGTYPPGSTVKPVIALAGLADGTVRPERNIACGGQWRMPGVSRPWREGRGGRHGLVDLRDSIARSCDVYFYGLANTLGVDRIASFLAPFGFGAETGIDIGGERSGILPSREWKRKAFRRPQDQVWFPGETVNFGIGQGYMLVTPLQLAHITGVIAARGKGFKPRLVTAMRDPRTGAMKTIPPARAQDVNVATPAQWQIIVEGMIQTMTRGTARGSAAGAAYAIAGKTGTAQVFSVAANARYDEKTVAERLRDHAWFIAFAPAEAPRIALAVLVENGGFGATSAAPIARKVMDAYLVHLAPTLQRRQQHQPRLQRDSEMIYEEITEGSRTRRTLTGTARMLLALKLDGPLLIGLALVAAYGLIVLYSSSGQSLGTVIQGAVRLGLGAIAMLVLAQVNPLFLRRASPWLYGLGILLLVIVDITGYVGKGAQRWLDLGFIRFQPSELMKLAVPMICAWYLHDRPLPPTFADLCVVAVMILIPAGLVVMQPDLGTGVLIAIAGGLVIVMGGLQGRIMAGIVGLAGLGAWIGWSFLHDYQRQRVLTFIDPQTDPLGAGYHTIQSQIAIGSGGVFGKGWMNGSQVQLEFLPESSTDFIFAVIGEEFGLLGLLILLLLYLFVVGRALYLATQPQDTFGRLLGGSLAATFFVYVFINAGMVSGLLPVVGVPLPLVSYGGTSMVTLLAGFGILMSLCSYRKLISS